MALTVDAGSGTLSGSRQTAKGLFQERERQRKLGCPCKALATPEQRHPSLPLPQTRCQGACLSKEGLPAHNPCTRCCRRLPPHPPAVLQGDTRLLLGEAL